MMYYGSEAQRSLGLYDYLNSLTPETLKWMNETVSVDSNEGKSTRIANSDMIARSPPEEVSRAICWLENGQSFALIAPVVSLSR